MIPQENTRRNENNAYKWKRRLTLTNCKSLQVLAQQTFEKEEPPLEGNQWKRQQLVAKGGEKRVKTDL